MGVLSLAEEMDQASTYQRLARQIVNEKREIVHQVNILSDQLNKSRCRTLGVERFGSRLQVGSDVLLLGGLATSTVNRAGLSLALTTAGTATGILAACLTGGAGLKRFYTTQASLQLLIARLEHHYRNLMQLLELGADQQFIEESTKFRATLDKLTALSRNSFFNLILKIGASEPTATHVTQKLPTLVDPRAAGILLRCLVRSFRYYWMFRKALWALLAYRIAGAEVAASLPGTPLTMSVPDKKKAVAIAAAILVFDLKHLANVKRQIGRDTPAVKLLRSIAQDAKLAN